MSIEQIATMTREAQLAARRLYMVEESLGKFMSVTKNLPIDLQNLKKVKRTVDKFEPDLSNLKELKRTAKDAEKIAKEGKNLWDKFLSKTKGAGQLAKAGEAGSTVAKSGAALAKFAPILTALAAVGITLAVNIIQGWRNDINEDGQQLLSQSISKILGLMNVQKLKIDKINVEIKKAELENQRYRDRVYSIEKQQPAIRDSIADAKKKSNDALYEARAGKVKLEAQIADAKKKSNDALYETRAGRTKLEDKIANVQSQINKFTQSATGNFQAKIEVTIGLIQNRLSTTENKVANLEKTKPTLQDKVIQTVQDSVKKVGTDVGTALTKLAQLEKVPAQVQTLQSQVKTIEVEHPKRWGITVTQAEVRQATVTQSTDSATRTYVERKLATVTQSQFSATEWVGRYGVKTANLVDNGVDSLRRRDEVLAGGITALATDTNQRIQNLENRPVVVLSPEVNALSTKIRELEAELEKTKLNEKKIGVDVKDLNTKIKEQEKVNKDAIPKLDQILGILPFIPARTADVIRPSIATIPQIENAVKTGTCQTFQPGGCGAKALDGLGNSVNQNTNNQSNNLFDKLNAGENAAQLALLRIIDNKLGNQITGGISGKLVDGFKWLHLDRVLSILTFAATVQNHLMLSNDIGQTLIGAFTNVLTLIGLKDDKGEAFDVGSVINSTVENLVKGIVGAENYAAISAAWAKANRIYQATTNVLNSFLSLSQTILQANELIAGYTGKIGNALKKGGVVLENAYGWLNPQPKFNRVSNFLEGLQQGASTIQMVTQAPLDVINATTEFTTASTEFVKAVKEDDKPENKAMPTPEPDELKAKETNSKAVSQPLSFDFSDLFDGED